MSIPSIPPIPSVPATLPVATALPSTHIATTEAAARASSELAAATPGDLLTQAPSPPRFPWLSRQSWQAEEAAAQKRPVFDDAPVIGDGLNASA